MRTARRVKQKLLIATYHDGEPLYEKDSEGNIIYDTMSDGVIVPRQIGETPAGYDDPVEFWNSITGTLTEDELQAFGSETRSVAKITYKKEEFNLAVGDLIWHNSAVVRNDGVIDESSADYRVIGIQDTGRHFYKALLTAIV